CDTDRRFAPTQFWQSNRVSNPTDSFGCGRFFERAYRLSLKLLRRGLGFGDDCNIRDWIYRYLAAPIQKRNRGKSNSHHDERPDAPPQEGWVKPLGDLVRHPLTRI